jgi:hypothetical protein
VPLDPELLRRRLRANHGMEIGRRTAEVVIETIGAGPGPGEDELVEIRSNRLAGGTVIELSIATLRTAAS